MKKTRDSVLAGLFFGVIMGLFFLILFDLQSAVVTGLVAGIGFGLGIWFFLTSKKIKKQTELKLEEGEEVLFSGRANHIYKGEALGGMLYLLKDRLQFKAHNFNVQNQTVAIALSEIKEIEYYNTLGIIPNGLKIRMPAGETAKFVVNNRKQWKEQIEEVGNKEV
ncbi:MAG: hypothetical protein ACOC2E_01995 [Bacteroidota bacterium]